MVGSSAMRVAILVQLLAVDVNKGSLIIYNNNNGWLPISVWSVMFCQWQIMFDGTIVIDRNYTIMIDQYQSCLQTVAFRWTSPTFQWLKPARPCPGHLSCGDIYFCRASRPCASRNISGTLLQVCGGHKRKHHQTLV